MSSRALMSLSAGFLAILGLGTTFLPQELLVHAGTEPVPVAVLLVQLLGALYLGLAMLNWMSRGFIAGGIYGRPVTLANLVSFGVGAIALAKVAMSHRFPLDITIMAAVYVAFALWFARLLFTQPDADAKG